MGEQRDEYKIRDKGQPKRIQGGCSETRHEAQLRETMRLRGHLRCRFPARARLSLAHCAFPGPQPATGPYPGPLEVRYVFNS